MLLSQVGHVLFSSTWFGLASAQEFEWLASKFPRGNEEDEDEEDEEEPLKEKFWELTAVRWNCCWSQPEPEPGAKCGTKGQFSKFHHGRWRRASQREVLRIDSCSLELLLIAAGAWAWCQMWYQRPIFKISPRKSIFLVQPSNESSRGKDQAETHAVTNGNSRFQSFRYKL